MFIRVSFKIITLMTEILSFFQQESEEIYKFFNFKNIFLSDCTSSPSPGWRACSAQRSAVNVHVLCLDFMKNFHFWDVECRQRRQKEVLTFFKI